jgi:P27 family predicted phage terminase small subunit
MAGRPPKPSALHLVQGTKSQAGRGAAAAGAGEPEPMLLNDLTPPAHLPESAKAVWAELAPKLRRAQLLTELDTLELEHMAVAVARWRKLLADTEDKGIMHNAETGTFSISPKVLLQQMYANAAGRSMTKFGMNPADRSRVMVNPQADLFEKPSKAANNTGRFFQQ